MAMGNIVSKEEIREFSGEIIGYVETDDEGNQTVRKFSGEIVGYYDINRNVTTDFTGFVVAFGNVATSLLYK